MCLLPLLSNPVRPDLMVVFAHVAAKNPGIPNSAGTIEKVASGGPGGIRTLVQTVYLTHTSIVNILIDQTRILKLYVLKIILFDRESSCSPSVSEYYLNYNEF